MKLLLIFLPLVLVQTSVKEERYSAKLKVDGIDCKACGVSVKKFLSTIKGLKVESVDIDKKLVFCSVGSKQVLSPSLIKSLLLKDDYKLSVLFIQDFQGAINNITKTIFVKDGDKEKKKEKDFWKLGQKDGPGYILTLNKDQQKLVEEKLEENKKREKPDPEVVFKISGELSSERVKVGEKEVDGKKVEEFEELVKADITKIEHIALKREDRDDNQQKQK